VPGRRFRQLRVHPAAYAGVLVQALAEAPRECCGLLAGRVEGGVGEADAWYPLVNAAASEVEFESEPRSMFEAMRDLSRRGLQVLAVYHSHPTSPPVPSRTDLERSYDPDVVNVIVSLQTDPPTMRAWWLRQDGYDEAELEVGQAGSG
jgi:proteasome lid subunit RPN8/RPN11